MSNIRHNWTREEIREIYERPLLSLVLDAANVHREHHVFGEVQISSLLSIKTGGCSEDCGYCPQAFKQVQSAAMPGHRNPEKEIQ